MIYATPCGLAAYILCHPSSNNIYKLTGSDSKRRLSIYVNYGYLEAVLSLNNIVIFDNYLGEGQLLNYYLYLIYLHCFVKKVYYILITIIYNYSRY